MSLFPATRGTTLRLRMVDADGNFLKRRFFGTDESKPLDANDLVRGYEFEKDRFVIIEDDELEALDPEKSREIELAQFVELHSLSPLYFERAYFLVPDGGTTKAYRLRAETLRFADEVRSPDSIGLPAKVAAEVAAVAQFTKAIKALKVKTLDRAELQDDRNDRIVKLAEQKLRSGTDVVAASEDTEEVVESSTNVIDLMEVLRERLQGKLRARSSQKARPSSMKWHSPWTSPGAAQCPRQN